MATFYFNAAVDSDWQTLGNWWMDDQFSVQATALPTSTDDVIASASITSNSGSAPTVANATFVSGASNGITITVTGDCTFNGAANYGTITGDCTFNENEYYYATNSGTITGDCTFNDSSRNDGYGYGYGSITGNCVFNDSSSNQALVTGNCVFNDGANCYVGNGYAEIIIGNCVFNDGSWNGESINGDCVFNDSSFNGYYGFGSAGNCIFNHNSANGGSVNNAVFNDSATLYWTDGWGIHPGRVAGNCTLSVASAALTLDAWGQASFGGNDRIVGTIEIKYDKGINGSSILGVV